MKPRSTGILAGWLWMACGGCSQDAMLPEGEKRAAAAETAIRNEARNGRGAGANGETPVLSGDHLDVSVPETSGKCTFEERDPAERPANFVPANFRSNVIFYQRPKGSLWSHVYADGRVIAELTTADVIVAARFGKPDLWIRPKVDGVTLEAGRYRLACY